MKIAIACDHEAFYLKEALIPCLKKLGHSVRDFGTHSLRRCDYPDYALEAALSVSAGDCDKGIVLCATGVGVSIAANKIKGIRCALANDVATAISSRQLQDANMLAIGASMVDEATAFAIAEAWVTTPFSNEDAQQDRIDKIMEYEDMLEEEKKQQEKERRKQEKERRKQEKELEYLRSYKRKHKPAPYRPRRFGFLNKAINGLVCTILILSLLLFPLVSFLTDISDPKTAINTLLNSGILDSLLGGSSTPEATDPEATDPEIPLPSGAAAPDPTTAGTGFSGTGFSGGRYPSMLADDATVPPEGSGAGAGSMDISSLLGSIQALVDAGVIDEKALKDSLGEDVDVDMDGVRADFMESDLAKQLVTEYVGSVVDSAVNPDATSAFTEDKVREIMDNHMGELTAIVNNNLTSGSPISEDTIRASVSTAIDAALPAVMDAIPDISGTAQTLIGDNPIFGKVLKVLKFVNSGALRAINLMLILALFAVVALIRLPGLHGLTTIGVAGTISGLSCCGIYLLLTSPATVSFLGSLDIIGAILTPMLGTLTQSYYTSAIVFSFLGIALVLCTTVLRGIFGRIFHAIFAD